MSRRQIAPPRQGPLCRSLNRADSHPQTIAPGACTTLRAARVGPFHPQSGDRPMGTVIVCGF